LRNKCSGHYSGKGLHPQQEYIKLWDKGETELSWDSYKDQLPGMDEEEEESELQIIDEPPKKKQKVVSKVNTNKVMVNTNKVIRGNAQVNRGKKAIQEKHIKRRGLAPPGKSIAAHIRYMTERGYVLNSWGAFVDQEGNEVSLEEEEEEEAWCGCVVCANFRD
jgi:hypothetical protein